MLHFVDDEGESFGCFFDRTFRNVMLLAMFAEQPAHGPLLNVLAGVTAAGKTEWALRWAEAHGAEVLSCDAYCVYQGMDIGTAKPTPDEQARVPHHGIDLVPVQQAFSVAQYQDYAAAVIERLAQQGTPCIVAGGSGFYLKAFFAPVADRIEVTPDIRERVRCWEESGGLPELLRQLSRIAPPDQWGALDTHNPHRVRNALHRCLATGLDPQTLRARLEAQGTPFDSYQRRLIILDRPDAELQERIHRRAAQMLAQGLVAEVSQLLQQGLETNPSAARAIGYREVIDYLQQPANTRSQEQLLEEIASNTWRLVKQQRKWFRTQLPSAEVVHPDQLTLKHLFA